MVMSRNKVLVVLEDGDALLMQPPNSRCGAFIILADNFAQDAKVPTEQHAESACFLQGTQPYPAASHINE